VGTSDYHARRAEDLVDQVVQGQVRGRRAGQLTAAATAHAILAVAAATRAAAEDRPLPGTPGPTRSASAGRRNRVSSGLIAPGEETLFDRLRGRDGISSVVQEFYTRVLRDPQLDHYFADVPMWRLQRHMVAFLVQATGGPKEYEGREMREAHTGLDIRPRDFDRVAVHLVATLADFGVSPEDSDAVVEAIASLKPAIATEIEPDPGRMP
jgi:hemoglobin